MGQQRGGTMITVTVDVAVADEDGAEAEGEETTAIMDGDTTTMMEDMATWEVADTTIPITMDLDAEIK